MSSPKRTPSPSGPKGIHKTVMTLRPRLTRSQTSFSRALESVVSTDNPNLTLPENVSSTDLPASTKTTIKNDINLVQEVHHESTPLTVPEIQTPLLTPLPIPNTKHAFIEAVHTEAKKIAWTKAGLEKYLEVIHSNEHTVFSASFLANQTASTNAAIQELDEIKIMLQAVVAEVTGLATPAITPAVTPSVSGTATPSSTASRPTASVSMADYFTSLTPQDVVKNELKEKFGELRGLVARIRGIVVAAHVFYKINYALAADKKV